MEDLDYQKLLSQLLQVEGPKLARYVDANGNLIVAEKPHVESVGLNAGKPVTVLEATCAEWRVTSKTDCQPLPRWTPCANVS
jgi:hypothetical protein